MKRGRARERERERETEEPQKTACDSEMLKEKWQMSSSKMDEEWKKDRNETASKQRGKIENINRGKEPSWGERERERGTQFYCPAAHDGRRRDN